MSETSKPTDSSSSPKQPSESNEPKYGFRNLRTTSAFRVLNFELFVKPNKFVMAVGLVAITGCVAYLAYMNAQLENKKMYKAENEDGTFTVRSKKSKWD